MHLSKHRLEALTDGIYAVAMTLLVIELRVPEIHAVHSQEELIQQVADQIPQFISWVLSFFVLGVFWFAHHRMFHFVKTVNGPLVAWSLAQLLLVGLFPFSSSLTGKFTAMLFAQVFYSTHMSVMALVSWAQSRYIHMHTELCGEPMPDGAYRAARFRTLGLFGISVVAVLIALVAPKFGNMAFMLMAVLMRVARRLENEGPRTSRTVQP